MIKIINSAFSCAPSGPGCSKLGEDNPRLGWNLLSGLKALKENSVQIFLLAICPLGVLKTIEKMFPKRLWKKKKNLD